ncbi:hypothetical protein ABAC460_14715 [Asticcacaulis sp. AC460]|uniref:S1C family serine protease n=1 Tax=Asticcacaulis sp. AC460 TaxID=1282360 RepID=UPI0003C3B661|nr:serine protease [Asticcacaulis sp. AC460]ESQ89028.1 hypothetical protein ABAC460_14715 [Asticcacaulis sp. AC460]
MLTPTPGQRIQVVRDGDWLITALGRDADRVVVCAVGADGAIIPFAQGEGGRWMAPSPLIRDTALEVIAYINDDRSGGFVNTAYPIQVEIAGQVHSFPEPDQQLAAVILAEIYAKDGVWRAKVSNEGFTFGIEAFARARNLGNVAFPSRPGRADGAPSRPPRGSTATGSGVVIAPKLVVTNAHVIEDGVSLEIGRSRTPLKLVAADLMHDLALLEGEVEGSPIPMRLGSPLWLGEGVLAAGFPLMDVLGADLKVTTGNISGLTGGHGDVSRFQFTAPIGSGSSGGAIIDEAGNLVGITSSSLAHGNMRERGSISENVNFAIRAALVYELIAAAGFTQPDVQVSRNNDRRDVVQRLRKSVVSIIVHM